MITRTSAGTAITQVALCLMLAAVPLIYLNDIFEYTLLPKRLAQHACIVLALAGWFVRTDWGRSLRLASSPLNLPIAGLLGVALLSAPTTTHPLDTLLELTSQAALLGLFLVSASTLSRRHLRPLLWTNAATGLLVALIGILQYHNLAFVDLPTNGHPGATFGYRNFAAMYLVCAIPLSALLFLISRTHPARLLPALSTTLMGVYLVYTRTRGAWLGAGGAVLITGAALLLSPGLRTAFRSAWQKDIARPPKRLILVCAALFCILAPLPARFHNTGLQRFDEKKANIAATLGSIVGESGDRGRLRMWANTLRMIADRPLLGVGPGGWKRAYPPYDRGVMIRDDTSPKRPHNDYLWIASEHGLPGLCIYLYLLFAALRCLVRLARRTDTFWPFAAPAFAMTLLATSGHALFSFPREQPQASMFLYLLLGVIAGASARNRPVSRLAGVGLLLASFAVSLGAAELSRRHILFDRHYLRALWLEDAANWPALLAEVDRTLSYGIFRPHILVIRGRGQEKLERYDEAETSYKQALEYFPHSWYAHNGLGIVYKRQGKFEDALRHYQRALAIHDTPLVRNNLGALYKSTGDLERAEGEYRRILRSRPRDPGANNNMGNIYKARGELDSAAVSYRRALENDSTLVQAHYNLADVYQRQNHFDQAILHFYRAAVLDPDNPRIYWGLGVALESAEEPEGAEHAYRRAIALRPDFEQAHFNLGNILYTRQNYPGAKAAYRTFLSLWEQDDAYARYARQRLETIEERTKKATGAPHGKSR